MSDLNSSVALVSTSVPNSATLPTASAPIIREVTIELTDLTVTTQPAISAIVNDPKITKLRAHFSSLIVQSLVVECHTTARLSQLGDVRPVRFGITGSRNADIAAADAIELPYLSTIVFSDIGMVKESNQRIPTGLNMDLAAVALHGGHPVVIITSDGGITAALVEDVVPATDLVSGFVTLCINCSGVGMGVEYDL